MFIRNFTDFGTLTNQKTAEPPQKVMQECSRTTDHLKFRSLFKHPFAINQELGTWGIF